MRHLKKGRIFGRERDVRRAFLKSLASSFFLHGRIVTTQARAKELRPLVEREITRGKNPTLANRRLLRTSFSNDVVKRIVTLSEDAQARPGGYTRIIKLGSRKSDSANMAILEIVK